MCVCVCVSICYLLVYVDFCGLGILFHFVGWAVREKFRYGSVMSQASLALFPHHLSSEAQGDVSTNWSSIKQRLLCFRRYRRHCNTWSAVCKRQHVLTGVAADGKCSVVLLKGCRFPLNLFMAYACPCMVHSSLKEAGKVFFQICYCCVGISLLLSETILQRKGSSSNGCL